MARIIIDKTWLIILSHSNIVNAIYFDELHPLQVEQFKDKRVIIYILSIPQRCFTSIHIYHHLPSFKQGFRVIRDYKITNLVLGQG